MFRSSVLAITSILFTLACDARTWMPDASDSDAAVPGASCGNGRLDPGERCDVALASGADACPSLCNDGIDCTSDELIGEGCEAHCEHAPIADALDGDRCCPAGATADSDDDCAPGCGDATCATDEACGSCATDCGACCGNGRLDTGERCDDSSADPCPLSCDDANACTTDGVSGSASACDATCAHEAVTRCAAGDGCCPSGCAAASDADCVTCTDICVAGSTRCNGNAVETCVRGADGCTDWGDASPCPFGADSYPICAAGACTIGCNTGFASCDGVDGNGCEVHIAADISNCGECNARCGTAGGSASCSAMTCSIVCAPGRANCDGLNASGCEVSLSLDARNCGSCGHSCLDGSCRDGACAEFVLAGGFVAPIDVAIDDSYVYVLDRGTQSLGYVDGAIYRVSKSGGARTAIATGLLDPKALVVDASYVFFTTMGRGSGVPYDYPNGGVWRVAKTGGVPVRLSDSVPTPNDLALDETYVYFASGGTYGQSGGVSYHRNDGAIGRIPRLGGATSYLATSLAEPVALALTGRAGSWPELAWANRGGFSDAAGGIQLRSTTGVIESVLSGQPVRALGSDGTYAYYAIHNGGVRRTLLYNPAAQPPQILADARGGSVYGLSLDESYVYFPNLDLRRVPSGGGVVEALTHSTSYPAYGALANDERAVYWVAEYSGVLLAIAK